MHIPSGQMSKLGHTEAYVKFYASEHI